MLKYLRRTAISIEGDRSAILELARGRLMFLGTCFALFFTVVLLRVIDLGVVQGDFARMDPVQVEIAALKAEREEKNKTVLRGNVYDRNGILLATTLKTASLFVDPSLVFEPEDLSRRLAEIFPDLSYAKMVHEMRQNKRFAWIKRSITPDQQKRVLDLGEPGLGFEYESRRVYPQGDLFAHVVGFTDRDGMGLSGIERNFESQLAAGQDVKLSVDTRLQHVAKREVSKAMADFTARGGVGIIMDAHTGEMLAGVSLPDFNLNDYSTAIDDAKFNRLTLGVYEMGSMFKIFSTAALLENFNVEMDHTFDARFPIKIGRFRISDYHPQKRMLTIPEVFMHSSNIGTAMMAQTVGGDKLRSFYADLGLLSKAAFDIREVGAPIVPSAPWSRISTMTVSYGHGLSTTPIQMAGAVATIVNGGFSIHPTLLMGSGGRSEKTSLRVLSQETSDRMRKLLRLVVTKGTGKNADVPGYAIGGKTGTAEKSINGRYERKKLMSSFVGAFPIDNPRYIVMVMVDEPIGNKKSYGYATAGWVAAPPVGRIVTAMGAILGMPTDHADPAKDISLELLPYLIEHKEEKKVASN